MSSHRGLPPEHALSVPASPPSALPSAPPSAPRRLPWFSRLLTASLLVAASGCSTAGDKLGEGETGGAAGLSAGDSPGDVTGEPTTSGYASDGWDPGGSSGGGEESTGAQGTEPPPDVPLDPADAVVAEKLDDIATCDPEAELTWRMAMRDACAMSSPSQAREAVLGGWLSLTGLTIRPWEFLNYYTFVYPPAEPGSLRAQGQMRKVEDDVAPTYELQLAISGPVWTDETRPKVHLTLAIDNSGSMLGPALDMVKASSKALASRLRAGDTVSLVTWNPKNAALLEHHVVTGPDDPVLLEKIDLIEIGGSAELYSGLGLGYKLAEGSYVPEDINRLIVVSDGGGAATETDLTTISERAADQPGKPGIYLVGVGVGDPGTYRADLVEGIARAGRGPALFVGSELEATRQFSDRFLGNVGVAATDLRVAIKLPKGLEFVRDDFASESALPEDRVIVPANDTLVLQRRVRACVLNLDLQSTMKVELQWIDPLAGQDKATWIDLKLADLLGAPSDGLTKGAAVLAFAEALQAWQGVRPDVEAAVTHAQELLQVASQQQPSDPELAEIAQVLAVLQEEE